MKKYMPYISALLCMILCTKNSFTAEQATTAVSDIIKKLNNVLTYDTQYYSSDNCVLILTNYDNSNLMANKFKDIATQWYRNDNFTTLLCSNENKPMQLREGRYCVRVRHYAKTTTYRGPTKGPYFNLGTTLNSNDNSDTDLRLATNSSVIFYLLHSKALELVPLYKHIRELKDMLEENVSNRFAPVIVCVNNNILSTENRTEAVTTFKNKEISMFLSCLQQNNQKNETDVTTINSPVNVTATNSFAKRYIIPAIYVSAIISVIHWILMENHII